MAGRQYKKNSKDQLYDSVTTVLGLFPSWPLCYWYGKHGTAEANRLKKEAGVIGTQAHEVIHLENLGETVDPRKYDSKVAEAYRKFQDWKRTVDYRPIVVEKTLFSERYKIAGTLDSIAYVNGQLALIDWKTGKGIYQEQYYQLSAYKELHREMEPKAYDYDKMQRWILNFNAAEQDFRAHPCDEALEYEKHEHCWNAFKCYLFLYRMDKQKPNLYAEEMQVVEEQLHKIEVKPKIEEDVI